MRKHGVRFADAVYVLEDERALTIPDDSANEARFVTIGKDSLGRVLVVVWTSSNGDRIRLISARKATGEERTQYRDWS